MAHQITLRPAQLDEADALSELALRSKGHWGYDEAFLEACRPELTLCPDELSTRRVVVAVEDDAVIGFASLEGYPPQGDVGYLFVEPTKIGQGVGVLLWDDLCGRAKSLGFERLRIESEPRARPFYLSRGARQIGKIPSGSIPGRELPLLEYTLTAD